MPFKMRVKLSAMMFLQFMMLPVWFVPMFPYVEKMAGGAQWAFWCGMIMGFGTLASPLFGMFADRFLNAEKVLALCNFTCAALLGACYFVKDPALLFFLLLAVMIVYMPSWSLTATIAMANSTTAAFPQILPRPSSPLWASRCSALPTSTPRPASLPPVPWRPRWAAFWRSPCRPRRPRPRGRP